MGIHFYKQHNYYLSKFVDSIPFKRCYTARKSIFLKSWNIMESSKRPSKYPLSISFLAQKNVFPISKNFKTRPFQQSVNIIFPSTFCLKKDGISHLRKGQNKNFSIIDKYHISINFFAQKETVLPISGKFKARTFQ